MNELIKIDYTRENPTVLGRDLHAALKVETPYRIWFPRMVEYGFTDGVDYLTVNNSVRRADGTEMPQTQTDHRITVDMAKEICMLQRTEKGKECRQYFIELEKKWNDPASIMARALQLAERQIESLKTVNVQLLPKADYFDKLVSRGHLTSLRETAKELSISERYFVESLIENEYLYRNKRGVLLPMNGKNRGYFEVKDYCNTVSGHTGVQTLVTVTEKQFLIRFFNGCAV